jgi:signal transduction histidine kinase
MPEAPSQGIDSGVSSSAPLSPPDRIVDAPAGGASRGGGIPDDLARARRLRALATEIETLPTTHAAFARLLHVAMDTLQGAGAWLGLTMEDSDALVVVAAQGTLPVESGARVARDRAFAARALSAHSAVFADPSTGVRWTDTVLDRTPVRAVAAPLMVDAEHAVGVLSVIGGPGRLFTVGDGTFARDLAALATQVLRRPDRTVTADARVAPADDTAATAAAADGAGAALLLDAAAAVTIDDFCAAMLPRIDDPAFLGVSIAVYDAASETLRFPAALGALASLRGVRTPLESARATHLARQRRTVQLPDARDIVPQGWRSLVPALPGASIALVDGDTPAGRIDLVYDPDRQTPTDAAMRVLQQANVIARAIRVVESRVARTPVDPGLESLHALRSTLVERVHDLSAPIAGISALAELLADEALPDDLQELIGLIQKSAQRAAAAARTLQTLADDSEAHPEPVAVDEVIHAILRERAEAQRALAMTVQVSIDAGAPLVVWPKSALRDWIAAAVVASETALLGSARRRIDVRFGQDGAMAVLTVADDGVPVGSIPSERVLHAATMSVIRTDDGRTIRRLAIPLRIGTSHPAS